MIKFLFLKKQKLWASTETAYNNRGVSQIVAIKKHRHGELKKFYRDMFIGWLEQEGGGNYPVTWQGLSELLEDLELSALAKQVQQFYFNIPFQFCFIKID